MKPERQTLRKFGTPAKKAVVVVKKKPDPKPAPQPPNVAPRT